MAELTDSAALAARLRLMADELVDVGQAMVRIGEDGEMVDAGHYLARYVGKCVLLWADAIDGDRHG
jgi:hypothetical protein